MKSSKWIGLIVALLVVGMLVPMAVSADTLEGQGVLWARGSGLAVVRGRGVVEIDGFGSGWVLVQGADRVIARGTGIRRDLPGNQVLLVGWRGLIDIRGARMMVTMRGPQIEFKAIGRGQVHLRGEGVWRTLHARGTWCQEGQDISLDAA